MRRESGYRSCICHADLTVLPSTRGGEDELVRACPMTKENSRLMSVAMDWPAERVSRELYFCSVQPWQGAPGPGIRADVEAHEEQRYPGCVLAYESETRIARARQCQRPSDAHLHEHAVWSQRPMFSWQGCRAQALYADVAALAEQHCPYTAALADLGHAQLVRTSVPPISNLLKHCWLGHERRHSASLSGRGIRARCRST